MCYFIFIFILRYTRVRTPLRLQDNTVTTLTVPRRNIKSVLKRTEYDDVFALAQITIHKWTETDRGHVISRIFNSDYCWHTDRRHRTITMIIIIIIYTNRIIADRRFCLRRRRRRKKTHRVESIIIFNC